MRYLKKIWGPEFNIWIKVKQFKGTAIKCDLNEHSVNVASDWKIQNCFKIQPVNLDIIKSWSATCPSTLELLQKMEFKINHKNSLMIRFLFVTETLLS